MLAREPAFFRGFRVKGFGLIVFLIGFPDWLEVAHSTDFPLIDSWALLILA